MRVNGFGVIGCPALPSRSKHRSSHPNRRFKYTSCYVTCKDSYRGAVHTCGIVRSRESGNVASGRSKRRLPAANGVLVRQTWGATCMSQWAMRAMVAAGIATAIVETYRDLSAGVTGTSGLQKGRRCQLSRSLRNGTPASAESRRDRGTNAWSLAFTG